MVRNSKLRWLGILPATNAELQFFSDLSKHTLQLQRQVNTNQVSGHQCTSELQNMGHTTRRLIIRNGASHVVTNANESWMLLCTWDIIPDFSPSAEGLLDPMIVTSSWQQVPCQVNLNPDDLYVLSFTENRQILLFWCHSEVSLAQKMYLPYKSTNNYYIRPYHL